MDYNQKFENFNKENCQNDFYNHQNGRCFVKVVKECYFPIDWCDKKDDHFDKKDKCDDFKNYYNREDNCYEKQKSYCDRDIDWKNEKDYDNRYDNKDCNKKNNNHRRFCCCGLFRHW